MNQWYKFYVVVLYLTCNPLLMQTKTVWKCHKCDLMFDKLVTADVHYNVFKHPVKKIKTQILQ